MVEAATIVAIVLGSLAGVLLLAGLIVCCVRASRKKRLDNNLFNPSEKNGAPPTNGHLPPPVNWDPSHDANLHDSDGMLIHNVNQNNTVDTPTYQPHVTQIRPLEPSHTGTPTATGIHEYDRNTPVILNPASLYPNLGCVAPVTPAPWNNNPPPPPTNDVRIVLNQTAQVNPAPTPASVPDIPVTEPRQLLNPIYQEPALIVPERAQLLYPSLPVPLTTTPVHTPAINHGNISTPSQSSVTFAGPAFTPALGGIGNATNQPVYATTLPAVGHSPAYSTLPPAVNYPYLAAGSSTLPQQTSGGSMTRDGFTVFDPQAPVRQVNSTLPYSAVSRGQNTPVARFH